MKKAIVAILSAIVALGSVLIPTIAADADSRLGMSITRPTVFIGSASSINTNAYNVSEKTEDDDWSNLKHEVIATMPGKFRLRAEFNVAIGGPCEGELASIVNSLQKCTFEFGERNIVLNTPFVTSYAESNQLRLTQTSGMAQQFRIRAWIDRNNNDVIDPYEPSSSIQSITTVDAQNAKTFLNYEVIPPKFSDSTITAWIGNKTANDAVDMIDPTLVEVRFHICSKPEFEYCKHITTETVLNTHPQLQRYEFTTSIPYVFGGANVYVVELVYLGNEDSDVILNTTTFDYRRKIAQGVTSEIIPQVGIQQINENSNSLQYMKQRHNLISPTLSSFTYKATLHDVDSNLVSNQSLYVMLDTSGIKTLPNMRVNGLQVATSNQDLVILRRDTDATGTLTLKIEYAGKAIEQLKIDIQMNGSRSFDFAQRGCEEVVTWDVSGDRTIALSSDRFYGTSAVPITLTAKVTDTLGGVATDGSVFFYGDSNFTFDTPVAIADLDGVSTKVRLSNYAAESGAGYVYAQTLSNQGWISTKLQISWKNYGTDVYLDKSVYVDNPAVRYTPRAEFSVKSTGVTVKVLYAYSKYKIEVKKNGVLYKTTYDYENISVSRTFAKLKGKTSLYQVFVDGKLIGSRRY